MPTSFKLHCSLCRYVKGSLRRENEGCRHVFFCVYASNSMPVYLKSLKVKSSMPINYHPNCSRYGGELGIGATNDNTSTAERAATEAEGTLLFLCFDSFDDNCTLFKVYESSILSIRNMMMSWTSKKFSDITAAERVLET